MAQLENIRDAMHQQPFLAFELRLLDGRMYMVKHPDFVAVPESKRKRYIVLFDDAGMHMIDLALIQEIVLQNPDGPGLAGGNGPEQGST